MNQSPPRRRTVRNAPPPLVRPRNQRQNVTAVQQPIQQRRIIHPPILRVPTINRNNSNAETIAVPNANRLANFNSNSNNNSRMPPTKRRKLMNSNKKNKNTKRIRHISIHKSSN